MGVAEVVDIEEVAVEEVIITGLIRREVAIVRAVEVMVSRMVVTVSPDGTAAHNHMMQVATTPSSRATGGSNREDGAAISNKLCDYIVHSYTDLHVTVI